MAAATPAVTDATACTPEELREAASKFLVDDPATLTFERTKGGVNNKVYRVTKADGETFVMRVYNNGCNVPRVRYEHAVLQLLQSKSFSFKIPELIPSLDGSGTFATLASGTQACLFKCIPGTGAKLTAARSIGKATAELVAAMADVKVEGLPLPNPLYRNMYDAHHSITRELFLAVVGDAAFDGVREATDFLVKAVLDSDDLCTRICAMDPPLPEQQIHADLHFDNVLTVGDEVSGLLDFEFTARDWTCMEIAVGLSKYIALPDIEPTFEAWIDGYREGGGRLTKREIELLPDLIQLRILNNVIYFAGRIAAKEDVVDCLSTRVEMYARRCKWIQERTEWMMSVLTAKLLAE